MLNLRLIGPLLLGLQLVAAVSHAQLVIDKTQSVRGVRDDPGKGLCGAVTHFATQPSPPSRRDEAVALADKPTGDPSVLGRVSGLLDPVNLRNGLTGSTGDFSLPGFPDAVFPYSSNGTPTGDDRNLVVRLRGYFNVTTALAGKVLSFAVNCDDFCALRIGTSDVIAAADVRTSPRVIRQVRFPDPGLYPVEIIHYQNAATSYLEWALAESAVAECPGDLCALPLTDASYAGKFTIVPTTSLYPARYGLNASCEECGAAGQTCPSATFCADGLCQTCNLPDHCGSSCVQCPASANICSSGKCVECTADDQCPNYYICDVAAGKCQAPQPCDQSNPCSHGLVCNTHCGAGLCVNIFEPCVHDEQCPRGQKCDLIRGDCLPSCSTAPNPSCCFYDGCYSDKQCPSGSSCDLTSHVCQPLYLSGGGCDGCALPGPPPRGSFAEAMAMGTVLLAGLGFLGWRARRRRGRAAARLLWFPPPTKTSRL